MDAAGPPDANGLRDADPWNLVRFLREQRGMHEAALRELRGGRKTGHWIWYEFPQLAGLGRSDVSRQFAISGLAEAHAYLDHPVLRGRLVECATALLAHADRGAIGILGEVDAMKVRSSMTLFALVDPEEQAFRAVLERLYGGRPDDRTLELLGR